MVSCLAACALGGSRDWRDPNWHSATDEQLVIRQRDGGVRFGVDLGDSFRAEVRDGGQGQGAVRGVYSYLRPDGAPFTLAYAKAPGAGYRPVAGGAAALPGVSLPAFPRSLYTPRMDHVQSEELLEPYGALAARDGADERTLDEDVVVVEPPQRGCEF